MVRSRSSRRQVAPENPKSDRIAPIVRNGINGEETMRVRVLRCLCLAYNPGH